MILSAWLLLGSLAARPVAARSMTSERFYHSGLASMKAKDYKSAMEDFMDALLIDPDYPDARESLREAGEQMLRHEKTRINREREYFMVEITDAQHSIGRARQLDRGLGSSTELPEADNEGPDPRTILPPPPPEDDEVVPELRATPKAVRRGRRRSTPQAAKPSVQAPAIHAVGGRLPKQTVQMDVDWLKPARPGAAPAAQPPPDTGELYLKGIRSYSAGDLPNAISAWEQCLKVDPGHAKARKALERAKREAAGGKQ